MGLEEGIAGEELNQDTAYAPDVAGERPAQVEDDLRSSVVTGRYDRRVVLIIECGRAKVDETNFAVQKNSPLPGSPRSRSGRRGNSAVVCEGLIGVVDK